MATPNSIIQSVAPPPNSGSVPIPPLPPMQNAGVPMTPPMAPQSSPSPIAQGVPQAPTQLPAPSLTPGQTLVPQQVMAIIQNAPQGIAPQDIVNGLLSKGYQLQGYQGSSPSSPSSSPSVGGFIGNAIGSAGNFIGGLGNAIMHPIQTIKNLGNAAVGGVEEGANTLLGAHYNNAQTAGWNTIVNYYAQRYGSPQAFLKTLYTDPVGLASDASVLADGFGLAADAADLGKVADVARSAADITNPAAMVGKGVDLAGTATGKVAAGVLGNTSGIGYGSAKSFLEGDEGAVNAMRSGEETEEGLVGSMQDAYKNMRKSQSADYAEAKNAISEKYPDLAHGNEVPESPLEGASLTNGVFSQSDLRSIFSKQVSQFGGTVGDDGKLTFENSSLPLSEQAKAVQMNNQINNWTDLSPAGINNLENLVHDYYSQSTSGNFQRLVIGADNGIKTYLRDKIPEFKEADANFAKVSQLMNRVKKELSVGGNASAQTVLNKVLKIANNDKDMRNALLKEFSRMTGKDIEGLAAGIRAHNVAPSGIFSKGLELFGIFHPAAVAALLGTSPRVAGEFLHGIGLAGTKYTELMNAIKASTFSNVISRAGNASGQIQKRKINIKTGSI